MTRQEKRGLGDIRAMKRHERIDEILVVKVRKKKKAATGETLETDSLVIGVAPGGCTHSALPVNVTPFCRPNFRVADHPLRARTTLPKSAFRERSQ